MAKQKLAAASGRVNRQPVAYSLVEEPDDVRFSNASTVRRRSYYLDAVVSLATEGGALSFDLSGGKVSSEYLLARLRKAVQKMNEANPGNAEYVLLSAEKASTLYVKLDVATGAEGLPLASPRGKGKGGRA